MGDFMSPLRTPSSHQLESSRSQENSNLMRACKAVDGLTPAIDIAKLPKMPRLGGSKDLSKVLEIVLPIAATSLILVVGTAVLLLLRRHLRYAELREDFFSKNLQEICTSRSVPRRNGIPIIFKFIPIIQKGPDRLSKKGLHFDSPIWKIQY
jgi:hypothetical protein